MTWSVRAGSAPTRPSSATGSRRARSVPCSVLLGQPHQDPPRELLPLLGQRRERALGRARHRAGDTAGGEVARQGQRPVAPSLPGLRERRRQQRQRPRAAEDVAHRDVGQVGLDRRARPPGRAPRRPARSSVSVIGGTITRAPCSALRQVGVLGQPTDVVAADDQHAAGDDVVRTAARARCRGTPPAPRPGCPADQSCSSWSQTSTHRCRRRVLAGQRRQGVDGLAPGHDHERLPRRRCPAARPIASAGSRPARTTDDLPAPLDPDTTSSRWSTRAVTRVRDQPVAAAEHRGVVELVAGQPLVGAPGDGRPRRRRLGAARRRRGRGRARGPGPGSPARARAAAAPGSTPSSSSSTAARGADRLQRVALPPAAVERQRVQRPPALVQRLLADQPPELGHRLGVAAEGELGLPERLQAVVADRPRAAPARRRGRRRPASRRTGGRARGRAPRAAGRRPRLDVAGRQQRPATGRQVGERGRVQLVALQRERVAVVAADDVPARASPCGRSGSSAVRSRTTWACSDLRPVRGGAPSQSASSSRSTLTEAGNAAARTASSRRSFAPGDARRPCRRRPRTSSGPRTAHCICSG